MWCTCLLECACDGPVSGVLCCSIIYALLKGDALSVEVVFGTYVNEVVMCSQGGKDEPLTELQRLQRNAMFPPGQRPHLGPSFDPSTDISLARYFSTPSSSGSRPRAPAPAASSDRQRRILRPHAPRPGLWFTLQASNSQ